MELIQKEYTLISQKSITPDILYNKIFRRWNDQRAGTFFHNSLRFFEPQDLSKAGDLVVNEGLRHFARLHVGDVGSTPDYGELGIGIAQPTAADFSLNSPIDIRLHLRNDGGFKEVLGMDEHYGVIWPFTIADATVAESGLFVGKNPTLGDIMICHNRFNPPINHTSPDNGVGANWIIQHKGF